MFRASMEYNMCLFSVVGSDRKLKITPQGQYEEQNLILGANQTQRVVQGQHGVQHSDDHQGWDNTPGHNF